MMSRAENTPWFKGYCDVSDPETFNTKNITESDREQAKRRRRIEEIQDAMRAEEEQWFLWL